jgi:hypothetical protein
VALVHASPPPPAAVLVVVVEVVAIARAAAAGSPIVSTSVPRAPATGAETIIVIIRTFIAPRAVGKATRNFTPVPRARAAPGDRGRLAGWE